jgi:hypothetical protein
MAKTWELIPSLYICDSCGTYLNRSITGLRTVPGETVRKKIPEAIQLNDVEIDRARRRTQSLSKLESLL